MTATPDRGARTVLHGLSALQRHEVVTRNDRGPEAVYLIQPEQRIAASYYRNGILHFFLIPAIVDLALDAGGGSTHDEALRLRDLLKFEFFFAEKGEFLAEVDTEAAAARSSDHRARSCVRSWRRTGRPRRRCARTATPRSKPTRWRVKRAGGASSSCCSTASTARTRSRARTSTARSVSPTTAACSVRRRTTSRPAGPSSPTSSTPWCRRVRAASGRRPRNASWSSCAAHRDPGDRSRGPGGPSAPADGCPVGAGGDRDGHRGLAPMPRHWWAGTRGSPTPSSTTGCDVPPRCSRPSALAPATASPARWATTPIWWLRSSPPCTSAQCGWASTDR